MISQDPELSITLRESQWALLRDFAQEKFDERRFHLQYMSTPDADDQMDCLEDEIDRLQAAKTTLDELVCALHSPNRAEDLRAALAWALAQIDPDIAGKHHQAMAAAHALVDTAATRSRLTQARSKTRSGPQSEANKGGGSTARSTARTTGSTTDSTTRVRASAKTR
jgi:hypothetical protein